MHSGQNTMAKNYIWGKMHWRKRRGFGKIHTKQMHSGQNTMEKNCIWGKMQWRKGLKSLGKIHRTTKSFSLVSKGRRIRFLSFLSTRHRNFCRSLENKNLSWIGDFFLNQCFFIFVNDWEKRFWSRIGK